LYLKNTIIRKEGRENPDYLIGVVAGNAAGTYYHYLDNEEVNIIAVEAAGLGVDSGESCYLRARESRCYSWRQDPIDAIYGWANYRTIFYFGRIRLPGVGPMHANLYATGRAQFIYYRRTSDAVGTKTF
jgi:tryptophan synthase beta chain